MPVPEDTFIPRAESKRKAGEHYLDIENQVAWGVSLEVKPDDFITLNFTVDKFAEDILRLFSLQTYVVLFGGYYSETGAGMRSLFTGTVHRVITNFPDNGRISFTVEALQPGYTQIGKDPKFYNYPDPDNEHARPFCRGVYSLTIKDILEGISEETGVPIGRFDLGSDALNREYRIDGTQLQQKYETDWLFLRQLAANNGCTFYIETGGGQDTLNMVDTKVLDKEGVENISFLYPLQGTVKTRSLNPDKASWEVTHAENSEMQMFGNEKRPRFLTNVTVTEDIQMANSIARTYMAYNPVTGERDTSTTYQITADKEGNRIVHRYTFDEEKAAEIDQKAPGLADALRNQGALGFLWSSGCADIKDETPQFARYYYKQESYELDSDIPPFDLPFSGIEVKATCNMDLDIRVHGKYRIRGIARYTSDDIMCVYNLMSLRHVWDSSGPRTEMVFKGMF